MVRANLEAFASIGLARNDFVSEICQMDHVTPDYILGQAKRLEAERRYSPGLLLTVIRILSFLIMPEQGNSYIIIDTGTGVPPSPQRLFFLEIQSHCQQGYATEQTHRPALKTLIETLQYEQPA
jgi:hypothetical protein